MELIQDYKQNMRRILEKYYRPAQFIDYKAVKQQ